MPVRESESLTDNLDDLSQQHAIAHILLQVFNQTLVSRFGQVVIRPVRVDLSKRERRNLAYKSIHKKKFQNTCIHDIHVTATPQRLRAASLRLRALFKSTPLCLIQVIQH